MHTTKHRFLAFAALSAGMVLQTGCSLADQILQTIFFAFNIVDVWT